MSDKLKVMHDRNDDYCGESASPEFAANGSAIDNSSLAESRIAKRLAVDEFEIFALDAVLFAALERIPDKHELKSDQLAHQYK